MRRFFPALLVSVLVVGCPGVLLASHFGKARRSAEVVGWTRDLGAILRGGKGRTLALDPEVQEDIEATRRRLGPAKKVVVVKTDWSLKHSLWTVVLKVARARRKTEEIYHGRDARIWRAFVRPWPDRRSGA